MSTTITPSSNKEAANGYTTQITLSPDALDETLVARIGLAPGSAPVSALYNVIPLRHTNCYPYDTGTWWRGTWQTILPFRVGYATHEGLRSPRRAVNDAVKP